MKISRRPPFFLILFLVALPALLKADTAEKYHNASPEERAAIRERIHARRQAAMVERFDLDGDGKLSPEEYAAAREILQQEWQQRQAERQAAVKAHQKKFRREREVLLIHRFDRNGDGRLSDAERQEAEATIRKEQEAHRAKR